MTRPRQPLGIHRGASGPAVPFAHAGQPAPHIWRKRLHRAIAALIIVLAAFVTSTTRLFIWPAQGMPARVDAIVMLNGPGARLPAAETLAWAGRARMLVVSRGSPFWGHGSAGAARIPGVRVICFDPSPSSTRGEAEVAGRLARQYRWRSVVLVTTPDQDTRARIRVARCFTGSLYVHTTPPPPHDWPWATAYEWAATVKALIFGTGC